MYFAPFVLSDGVLSAVGHIGNLAEFQEAVADGRATELRPSVPARSDGCFYFPTGAGDGEYTSFSCALDRLQEFAELECRKGDRQLRAGHSDLALRCYELAASTVGGPKYYARMLLADLPQRRRRRIQACLEAVATLTPASKHVAEARSEVWPSRSLAAIPWAMAIAWWLLLMAGLLIETSVQVHAVTGVRALPDDRTGQVLLMVSVVWSWFAGRFIQSENVDQLVSAVLGCVVGFLLALVLALFGQTSPPKAGALMILLSIGGMWIQRKVGSRMS